MGWMKDETGLDKCAANFVPLTPLSHLKRAATVFADRTALIYGDTRLSYADYYTRCTRLASALAKSGVKPGDVVATLLPNIPAQSEAAFGVPACGAVLNTINTRLDVDTIAYIFDHGEAAAVLCDSQFLPMCLEAIAAMDGPAPMIIEVPDPTAGVQAFAGGYFHSEDLAIQHPNGYMQIADRAKDIIISGGENISSVEVEGALMHHPAVNLCAVVAKPDDKWGEVPCAFVELKEGATGDAADIIAFVRTRLAGFKTPNNLQKKNAGL